MILLALRPFHLGFLTNGFYRAPLRVETGTTILCGGSVEWSGSWVYVVDERVLWGAFSPADNLRMGFVREL